MHIHVRYVLEARPQSRGECVIELDRDDATSPTRERGGEAPRAGTEVVHDIRPADVGKVHEAGN